MKSSSITTVGIIICAVALAVGCGPGAGDYNDRIIEVMDSLVQETANAAKAADQAGLDSLKQQLSATRDELREIGPLGDDSDLIDAALWMVDEIEKVADTHFNTLIRFSSQGDQSRVQRFQQDIGMFVDTTIENFDRMQQDFAAKHGFRVDKRPMKLPF